MRVYYWPWEQSGEEHVEAQVVEVTSVDELWMLVDTKKAPINEIIARTGQYILELSCFETSTERSLVLAWIDKE